MSESERRTISLPQEQAGYIDSLVNAGNYASVSEVVRAGLRALQERDAIVKTWLQEAVSPVYDNMVKNPSRGLSADQVLASIKKHHSKKKK